MRGLTILGVLGCAWVVVLSGIAGAQGLVNVRITALPLTDVTGKVYTIQDSPQLKDKLILWYFWSSTSKESMLELRRIAQLHRFYTAKGKNFEVITVSLDTEVRPARDAIRKLKVGGIHVIEGKGSAGSLNSFLRVQAEHVPLVSLMNNQRVIYFTGKPKAADDKLAKYFGATVPRIKNPAGQAADAIEMLLEAVQAIDTQKDYDPALKQLQKIPSKMLISPKVLPHAMALLMRIQMDAKDHPVQIARSLKNYPKAAGLLKRVSVEASKWLSKPLPGRALLAPKSRVTAASRAAPITPALLAARKMKEADRLRAAGERVRAYEAYKIVVGRYGDSEHAEAAAAHIEVYDQDPAFAAELRNAISERKARMLLALARGYAKGGRPDEARATYQKLVKEFPKSAAAVDAKRELAG